MAIILHPQAARLNRTDFNGITYELTEDGQIVIAGSFVLGGVTHPVPEGTRFGLAGFDQLYIQADGSLSQAHDADSYATPCWWDGTDLHVIQHQEVTP